MADAVHSFAFPPAHFASSDGDEEDDGSIVDAQTLEPVALSASAWARQPLALTKSTTFSAAASAKADCVSLTHFVQPQPKRPQPTRAVPIQNATLAPCEPSHEISTGRSGPQAPLGRPTPSLRPAASGTASQSLRVAASLSQASSPRQDSLRSSTYASCLRPALSIRQDHPPQRSLPRRPARSTTPTGIPQNHQLTSPNALLPLSTHNESSTAPLVVFTATPSASTATDSEPQSILTDLVPDRSRSVTASNGLVIAEREERPAARAKKITDALSEKFARRQSFRGRQQSLLRRRSQQQAPVVRSTPSFREIRAAPLRTAEHKAPPARQLSSQMDMKCRASRFGSESGSLSTFTPTIRSEIDNTSFATEDVSEKDNCGKSISGSYREDVSGSSRQPQNRWTVPSLSPAVSLAGPSCRNLPDDDAWSPISVSPISATAATPKSGGSQSTHSLKAILASFTPRRKRQSARVLPD
jgi:hypothetical protein